MFEHERAGYRQVDNFLRLASLSYVRTMIMERLITHQTTLETSYGTKPMKLGSFVTDVMTGMVILLGTHLVWMGRI